MLSKPMLKALNDQINKELYSAHLYMSMAGYFSDSALNGFSHWMSLQRREELLHARRLFDYVLDRGSRPTLGSIDAPPATFKNASAAVQAAYKAEVDNTKQINHIMDLAIKENDHATRVILQWFVEEQVEEEASAMDLVDKVKMAGDEPSAMLILDRELGQRVPEPEEDGK